MPTLCEQEQPKALTPIKTAVLEQPEPQSELKALVLEEQKSQLEVEAIGSLIAQVLNRIVLKSDWATDKKTIYHSVRLPKVSIKDYINRFVKFTEPNEEELIYLLIYIERYTNKTKQTFNVLTAHRLISAAFITAQKICDDFFIPMSYYAMTAGLSLKELNTIERTFLNDMEYDLFVTNEQYLMYKNDLVCKARKYEKKELKQYPLTMSAKERAYLPILNTLQHEEKSNDEIQKSGEHHVKTHFVAPLKLNTGTSLSSSEGLLKLPKAVVDSASVSAKPASVYNLRFSGKLFHLPPLKPPPNSPSPQCNVLM